MTHTITPSADGTYIFIKISGDITRQRVMRHNLEAHRLGKELGLNCYLMDVTEARNVESVVDNYYFAYKDMRYAPGIDPSARVAILVSPDDHSHDFIETLAQNNGWKLKLFTDREKAVSYLGVS